MLLQIYQKDFTLLLFCFLQSNNVEMNIQKKHVQPPLNSEKESEKSASLDEGNHKGLDLDFVHRNRD